MMDSQSVKTTEVGGEQGFAGGQKVNGRKRHMLVDSLGNLLKGMAHAANIGQRAAAERRLDQLPEPRWERLDKIWAEGGYQGADFQAWVKQTFQVELEISVRPPDQTGFLLAPFRWLVERPFAWLGPSPRLSKDYKS